MPDSTAGKTPLGLSLLMVITGIAGFVGAFALTLDKIATLTDPRAALSCDFSVLVQCGANLESAQGSVFGFPNPLMGIAGYAAVIVVGMATLARARFAAWFWIVFNLGLAFAMGFVIWLMAQSIFVLNTLCPWCMLVWAATIPLFLTVTVHNARSGVFRLPRPLRRSMSSTYSWLPFITLLCYIVVAVIAQLRLDVLSYL